MFEFMTTARVTGEDPGMGKKMPGGGTTSSFVKRLRNTRFSVRVWGGGAKLSGVEAQPLASIVRCVMIKAEALIVRV